MKNVLSLLKLFVAIFVSILVIICGIVVLFVLRIPPFDGNILENLTIPLLIVLGVVPLFAIIFSVMTVKKVSGNISQYEQILDSIPFPITVTDNDLNWTFVNKSVCDMLSRKREDFYGHHCSEWGAKICGTENCGVTRLKSGHPTTTFSQFGNEYHVDAFYTHDKNGNIIGHIELVRDITEEVMLKRKQAEISANLVEVADSFAASSREIASGASLLAKGSVEQATSVDQLLSSIQNISKMTEENAQKAEKAAEVANAIKLSAEKGTKQMDEMMTAVKEINDSGQNISKVIKSIDDIAFQTNILALNAAVEAARAGQHGKGFAVVAEEVRNLAAKSAEAAKDTETLIADSIEKAQLGSRIADDTAASLSEIVSGIGESTQIVIEIAKSSENQTAGISQINMGIEQVARVTEQNSAASEESAAASQEMSSQSDVLRQLITKLELDTVDISEQQALPPPSAEQLAS